MSSLASTLAARRKRGEPSLLVYVMAGSAPPDRLRAVLSAIVEAGATGLELGFPFSDPMAEGPVIQRAAAESLAGGFHWKDLLELLREVAPRIPCAVMTYVNPIAQRGPEVAFGELRQAGASALILPDLPLEEVGPFRALRKGTGVDTVLLSSPATSEARLDRLAQRTAGFLYLVSRYGTTGVQDGTSSTPSSQGKEGELRPIIERVHRQRPGLPVLVGFGVSTPKDVERHLQAGADGVIVGSVVQSRVSDGRPPEEIGAFVRELVAARAVPG